MSFVKKLKSKLESSPAYTVTQEIPLPIYESSLKGIIDPESIKERCLAIRDANEVDFSASLILKGAWKSPYYNKGTPDFERFSDLATALEDKLNVIRAYGKSEMRFQVSHIWIVIYTEGSLIDWHNHIDTVDSFTRMTGTYYPVASANAQPIEFKNKDSKDGVMKIPVTQDKVLIFPSALYHSVSASVDSELRIVVGFNFFGLS